MIRDRYDKDKRDDKDDMIRERLLFGIVPSACYQRWNVERAINRTQDGNWTHIRRSEDVHDFL